jgi:hypothetical protein
MGLVMGMTVRMPALRKCGNREQERGENDVLHYRFASFFRRARAVCER